MAQIDPASKQTLAIIFGASTFRRAPKLAQGRAFNNSAQDFNEYLVSANGMGLPRENINWLFDDSRSPSDQLQDIRDFLETRTAELTSQGTPPQDLLVYYVGHGLFAGSDQTYCLAIRSTDERSEGLTSIRAADLASIIKSSARFLRRFLIFDCCFSSAAYREFQSSPLTAGRVKMLEELPARGTTMLCSASAQDPSLAPEGLSHTMFTEGMLDALRQGHAFFGPRLSLSELGDLIIGRLKEAYPENWVRPEVHSPDQREGDVAGVCIFPNPAFKGGSEEKAPEPQRKAAIETAAAKQEAPVARSSPTPQEPAVEPIAAPAPPRREAHTVAPIQQSQASSESLREAAVPHPTHAVAHETPCATPAFAAVEDKGLDQSASAERPSFLKSLRFGQKTIIFGAMALILAGAGVARYIQMAPQRRSDAAVGHEATGEARYADGKLDEAVSEFQQAIALNPTAAATNGLGLTYRAQGNLQGAVEEFQKAITLMSDYDFGEGHYNLAMTYWLQGDVNGTKTELNKVVSSDSPIGFTLQDNADPNNAPRVTISIKVDKGLFLNSDGISWSDLGGRVNDIYKNLAERKMCIAPEYLDSYLEVQKVAQIARASGVDTICIIPPAKGSPAH